MCHADNRLVYDMVWAGDNTLFTLVSSTTDRTKSLDCYSVKGEEFTYSPSYISLDATTCYTRLIYCGFGGAPSRIDASSIIVVSPGTLTFFRLDVQLTTTTLTYSPPDTSLLTASCVVSQGLVFATDRGEVMLIPPELTSLIVLAQHRIGEAGFHALCSDGSSLFLFNETGLK